MLGAALLLNGVHCADAQMARRLRCERRRFGPEYLSSGEQIWRCLIRGSVYVGLFMLAVCLGGVRQVKKKKNSNSNQFGVVAALAQTPDLGFGRWAESDERAACFLTFCALLQSTWAPESWGLGTGTWDLGLDPRVGVRLR